jgi:hypothetical protein
MGWTFYNSSGEALVQNAESVATQAQMEAGTSTTAMVSAGRTQYHPGAAKFWAEYETSGAHSMQINYNMTSVTDGTAVGDSDFVIANDMDSADYAIVAGGNTGAPSMPYENLGGRDVGVFQMIVRDVSNNSVDATGLKVVGFGTLA